MFKSPKSLLRRKPLLITDYCGFLLFFFLLNMLINQQIHNNIFTYFFIILINKRKYKLAHISFSDHKLHFY